MTTALTTATERPGWCALTLPGAAVVRQCQSGLNIAGRASLQRLLQTVISGKATFKAILAYDVSRWSRFQDAAESAHYEYPLLMALL